MPDADRSAPAATAPVAGDVPAAEASVSLPTTWSRVVLTGVRPLVDGGRYPIKRAVGETVAVTAGAIVDGHEKLALELAYGPADDDALATVPMTAQGNDAYAAAFTADTLGRMAYQVRAWLDRFATWHDQFRRRVEGGEPEAELATEMEAGAKLLRRAAARATGDDARHLAERLAAFEAGRLDAALDPGLPARVRAHAPRDMLVTSPRYEVLVDPELARFAAWYEFFPRSARADGQHATLDDAATLLPRIAGLGYDIVYLPPIHPIGTTHRKGKDNAPTAQPGDVGSPWAIGGTGEDGTPGGHKAVHPDLGGLAAFDRFVEKARAHGLEVALDIAFQTSPDHPYVAEHPAWFYQRPDGTIRYAENPPKKYQDVYPLNFEGEAWPALWQELKSVFEHWIARGVTIFRVDNPHTKPFAFWAWCLAELRKDTPELIVLAEAFTRPKTMHTLAKIGFNNSYTYFTWRNTKEEVIAYGRELFQTDVAEFFRPNFWPNTPDILHDELVAGGRPKHAARFILAATLSSAYGVYGPPYEHVDNRQHPDREEYAQNEKYELRTWDWHDPASLQPLMQRVNHIRRAHPALQQMRNVTFVPTENEHLIAYLKRAGTDRLLVVVNLDPFHAREGIVTFDPVALDLPAQAPFPATDLLTNTTYTWQGHRHYVRLDPGDRPAHILTLG